MLTLHTLTNLSGLQHVQSVLVVLRVGVLSSKAAQLSVLSVNVHSVSVRQWENHETMQSKLL